MKTPYRDLKLRRNSMSYLDEVLTEVDKSVKGTNNEYESSDMVLKAMIVAELRRLNDEMIYLNNFLRGK
jgi:hypothetical protein